MRAALTFLFTIAAAAAIAQTGNAGRFTGCVTTDMDGNLTFCEPNHCSLLTGSNAGPKLSGHTVTLEGTAKEAADGQPRSISISRIVTIGPACNQSCALFPVHPRGIGSRDKPGSEGGTPGAAKPQ